MIRPLRLAAGAFALVVVSHQSSLHVIAQDATERVPDTYELSPDSKPQEGVPKGVVSKATITSEVYEGREFNYQVYVPAQYDEAKPAAVMVFQDGNNFVREPGAWHMPVVFDNLINKGEMPVTIGIFIDPGSRGTRAQEYDTVSDQFARFVIDEVLPEVGKTYTLTSDPDQRAICGFSSGAIAAFTVAWERPDEFRKVVSLFGSFTSIGYSPARGDNPMRIGGDMYPTLIRRTPIKPLKLFFQDGFNDLNNRFGSWYLANQRMVSALNWANENAENARRNPTDLRYAVKHEWGDGGHTANHGSSIFPDILRWLWNDDQAEE